MQVKRERLITLLSRGLPLLCQQHWNECGLEGSAWDMNWPRYGMLESEGIIKWFAIEEGSELIGYASICVTHPLHHQGDMQAMIDTIFLLKEYRKGNAGNKVIDEIEKLARADGANLLVFSERAKTERKRVSIGSLLKRIGFVPYETLYIKRMGA